jgi:Na+/H+ antiporter NhaD/arsenite permease-like protein
VIPALLIFAGTYLVMALGRFPGFAIDRAGAALLGAALMVATGVLDLNRAYAAVDVNTITLLLGMMIIVANLRLSGLFRLIDGWAIGRAGSPRVLLAAIVVVAGLFSAFFVNDAICLVLTPIVVDITLRLKRDPVPYLLAVAMASNAGSVATITGNPQNMIVGSLSQIPYAAFVAALAPVAIVGIALTFVLIAVLHRREFARGERFTPVDPAPVYYHRWLATKSLTVASAVVVLFFLGAPVAEVAILGGAVLLFTRRIKPEKVYYGVDWPLLVMFAGLFVVIAGFEAAGVTPEVVAAVGALDLRAVPVLATVTAVLSNLVSNVPAVLVLKPFVADLANTDRAWLTVAMASTLAGNFTLVGSIANLIVAERARASGIAVDFWRYFRVGAPLTVLTILFGVVWLSVI